MSERTDDIVSLLYKLECLAEYLDIRARRGPASFKNDAVTAREAAAEITRLCARLSELEERDRAQIAEIAYWREGDSE